MLSNLPTNHPSRIAAQRTCLEVDAITEKLAENPENLKNMRLWLQQENFWQLQKYFAKHYKLRNQSKKKLLLLAREEISDLSSDPEDKIEKPIMASIGGVASFEISREEAQQLHQLGIVS